jgi:hypothetical protein
MDNVISFAPPPTKTPILESEAVNRQALYLRGWAHATDEKFGAAVTIQLLEFALGCARQRAALGK